MMSRSFEDLDVWKAACRLAVALTQGVSKCKVYALRDQMIRSAVSIPSNIAEGSERNTAKDFSRFLYIALGSAAELRTQLYIARESKTISDDVAQKWIDEVKAITRMLQSLVNSLNR
ncbi:MAG: four helix bundle protein [Thermodesulfobacteriota bacterium]